MKFLDLGNSEHTKIFDTIISNGAVHILRCPFAWDNEEADCPMFELSGEPLNDHDCSATAWHNGKGYCELQPDFKFNGAIKHEVPS